MTLRDCVNEYAQNGYTPIAHNQSGIGSEVLKSPSGDRIVKIGQDQAYDVFVSHAWVSPRREFPTFYRHDKPAGEFAADSNEAFTVTEIEPLSELTVAETQKLATWISSYVIARQTGTNPADIPDPLGLMDALLDLGAVALRAGVNLDVLKTSNYLARVVSDSERQIVFADPFN